MAYHQRSLAAPRPTIRIGATGPTSDEDYDVDLVGQDDGRDPDPDASFRLLLQLGQGYFMYLYVIGMARPGDPRAFHELWLKGCVAVEVEMESHGAPHRVTCDALELPSVYGRVEVSGAVLPFAIERLVLASRPTDAPDPDLEVRWSLRDDRGLPAELTYTSRGGWTLVSGGTRRAVAPDERIAFGNPRRE